MENYRTKQSVEVGRDYQDRILSRIETSPTRLPERNYLVDNIEGCACPPCLCEKSLWTIVLSPAGITAAGGAYLATSPL